MLREIVTSRTHSQGLRRRWFQDEAMDLYVWHAEGGSIVAFQVAYDTHRRERAITWARDRGYSHTRVDHGSPFGYSMTPFLVADGDFDPLRVHADFLQRSASLDPVLGRFIASRLRLCAERRSPLRHGGWKVLGGAVMVGILAGALVRRLLADRPPERER